MSRGSVGWASSTNRQPGLLNGGRTGRWSPIKRDLRSRYQFIPMCYRFGSLYMSSPSSWTLPWWRLYRTSCSLNWCLYKYTAPMEEATPTHAQQVKLLAMALATAILIMQTVSAVKFSITSLHATTIIIMIGLVLPSLQRLACLDGFLSVWRNPHRLYIGRTPGFRPIGHWEDGRFRRTANPNNFSTIRNSCHSSILGVWEAIAFAQASLV